MYMCVRISLWYNILSKFLLFLLSFNKTNKFKLFSELLCELLCEFYFYINGSLPTYVAKWNLLLVPFPTVRNDSKRTSREKFRNSRVFSFQILPPLWVRMIMRQYKDISTVINPNEIFESAFSCSGVRWLLSHDLWHKFALNWIRFRCKSAILFRVRTITLSKKIWNDSMDQNYSDLSWWCSAGLMRSERIILWPRKSHGT